MAVNENLFEKLKVWQLAHRVTLEIYKLISKFPDSEKHALIDQIRRSAASIPANIVEGNERQTAKEFRQFLFMAKGSAAETKYHLILARDLGYLGHEDCNKLLGELNEIGKMISGVVRYLKSKV